MISQISQSQLVDTNPTVDKSLEDKEFLRFEGEAPPLKVKSIQEAVSSASPIVKALKDKTCLSYDGGVISWTQFATKVETLAAIIQQQPEGLVALNLKRSCSLIIAEAASVLSGRTFVPLDPTWPQNRVHQIIESAKCSVIIADEGTPEEDGMSMVYMNPYGDSTNISLDKDKLVAVPEPEIMYIMFTSGSTGAPKGVEVYTDSLYHFLVWKAQSFFLKEDDSFLIKTPCTFDVSVGEMFMPLVTGTRSHVLGDGLHLDAVATHKALLDHEITICHFVPSVLLLYLADVPKEPLPHLRMIQCTGEAVKMEHRKMISEKLGSHIQLLNLYGPTEVTVEVSYFYCEDCEDQNLSHGFPIGWVGPGIGMFITDVNDPTRLMKDGEKGEVVLSGIQVAKGYLGREDLTSERFIPCPWDNSGRGMMYRTGDLGCKNPRTGWFEYHGRIDRQVKIGGVRIELGEIESVTMQFFQEQLAAVAVVVIDGHLVGITVPRQGAKSIPSHKELSDAICSILPVAYNPTEWHNMSIDQIPFSSAGKIDYKTLAKTLEQQRIVSGWGEVYDELYDDNSSSMAPGGDPTMDWAGYTDSFNPGVLHKREVIKEWVMKTVEWTLKHARESAGNENNASVLEMGCGKGMILMKIAPHVREMVGADISSRALDHIRRIWNGYMTENGMRGTCETMLLSNCDAVGFERLPSSTLKYNTILCNGVSLYFPSFKYVLDYFNKACSYVVDGSGAILLGDVRSLQHSSIFQLRRLMFCGKNANDARSEAVIAAINDKDRCYDYRAFHVLKDTGLLNNRVSAVEVQLKEGAEDSEFTGYRYDVTLHCKGISEGSNVMPSLQVKPVANFASFRGHANVNIVTPEIVVFALINAMPGLQDQENDRNVYACLNIPNQRLYSDFLLANGDDDSIEYASNIGVKPSKLRQVVQEWFPTKHVVLTWSRDLGDDGESFFDDKFLVNSYLCCMDLYLVPKKTRKLKVAGLQAVSRFALGPHEEFVEKMTNRSLSKKHRTMNLESCINEVVDSAANPSHDSAHDPKVAIDLAKSHAERGEYRIAVYLLISSALGLHLDEFTNTLESDADLDKLTFEELGGNSFIAMKLIGNMRAALGAAPAVFKILTEPLMTFVAESIKVIKSSRSAHDGEWMVHLQVPGKSGSVASDAPIVVFFPTAGGSPKVFAHTFSELRKLVPAMGNEGLELYIAQPPGRDARAEEPNLTNFDKLVEKYSDALMKPLSLGVSNTSKKRKVIMCGDSLGSVVCWAIAQEFYRRFKFSPDHMIVSGNPSPEISTKQWGLGTVATKSIRECTDAELVEFLTAGQHSATSNGGTFDEVEEKEAIDALRCDCIMYEDFKRNEKYGKLDVKATLCRGGDDPLCSVEDMSGWKDEFESMNEVVLSKGGHHIYSECAPKMANIIVDIVYHK